MMKAGNARSGRTILAALLAVALVASMALLLVEPPAWASHVQPDDTVDNDGPAGTNDGPYWEAYLENLGVADATCWKIVNQSSPSAWVMPDEPEGEDWALVVVKQGTVNFVYNDPIAGHTYPSVGDNEPGYSHIIVCTVPEPDPGEIIVEKEVTEGSDQAEVFTFTESGFSLDDNTLAHGESGTATVDAGGDYSVAETVPEGWELESATCTSTEEGDDSTPEDINVSEGETVTCTFVNHEIVPGEIIVEKQVTEGSDEELFFDFTASYDSDGFSLADDDFDESGPLLPGTYSVEEIVPEGWTLESVTCTSDLDPEAEIDVSAIELTEGDSIECVFLNDETPAAPGEIIIEKQVTEGSDEELFFEFTASYDSDGFSLADDDVNESGPLPAGTYSVAELVPDGWELESAICDDQSPVSAISLQSGETVTCVFTNDEIPPEPEPGEIIIEKVVNTGGNRLFAFTFETTGFSLADDTLAHGESSSSGPVEPGVYSVDEVVPTGWLEPLVVCSDGSLPGAINVSNGETVTCTFTNTAFDQVRASIVVDVSGSCEVDDDDDGYGVITVEVSVDGGAEVVIGDASGGLIGTFDSDASVEVPEGAAYTWVATPNEGFEFPPGSTTSGTITIETCSLPASLPFTGMEADVMAALAVLMLGAGMSLVSYQRLRGSR